MEAWRLDIEHAANLCKEIAAMNPKIVLDVGGSPGFTIPVATHSVGWNAQINLDLCHDRLPFDDQSVDFVYSRHTIEDLADPTHILREIRRVGKRGYLETPSAACEMTRGVDAAGQHAGFSHHRWLCYDNYGVFTCLAKYPCAELFDRFYEVLPLEENFYGRNFGYRYEGPLKFEVIQNEQGMNLWLYDPQGQYQSQYYRRIAEAIGLLPEHKTPPSQL